MRMQKKLNPMALGALLGVTALALLPGVAHASVADETKAAFRGFILFAMSLGTGTTILGVLRVGYTYMWSDNPELTMTRAKQTAIGAAIMAAAIGIAMLMAGIYSQKTF